MVTQAELRAQAEGCFARGEFKSALDCYLALLADDPDNSELLNDLGTVLYAMGQVEESCRCYVRALEVDAACAPARENLRRVCDVGGSSVSALMGAWERARAAQRPTSASSGGRNRRPDETCVGGEGRAQRIEKLFAQGRYDDAYKLALRRVRSDVFNAGAWNDLAVIALEMCRTGEALGAIERAYELAPSHTLICENAAMIRGESRDRPGRTD